MAALYPPFHAYPHGPLTSEPLVEFAELYNLNVEGRWNVDDWSRVPSHTTSPEHYREYAVICAREWHKQDGQNGTSLAHKKRGPPVKYPDVVFDPFETPDERRARRNREAQARWREKQGLPPVGAKPLGRPPGSKKAAPAPVVTLSVGQLRALLLWCSQNSYTHDDASLALWLGSVGATLPADPA